MGARYHFDNNYGDTLTTVGGVYALFQTGDLNCNPGHSVGEHVQCVHEISYIVSGRGWMWIDNRAIAVQPGMGVINRTGERHRIKAAEDEHLRYFYLGFRLTEGAHGKAAEALRAFYDDPPTRVIADATPLQEAFVSLFHEILYRDAVSDPMLESCMHRIICGTYRLCMHGREAGYRIDQGEGREGDLIYDVLHYIDANAQHSGLLSTLGAEFGYSYDYIARKFALATGERLRDYYHARRFEKACEYLRDGMSVTAVSQRLGYESIHAFSNAFKKRFGVPPSAYASSSVLRSETDPP